jgi:hypothetical protein
MPSNKDSSKDNREWLKIEDCKKRKRKSNRPKETEKPLRSKRGNVFGSLRLIEKLESELRRKLKRKERMRSRGHRPKKKDRRDNLLLK